MNTFVKKIVISLGGSLIVPEKINIVFIRKFVNLISKYNKKYIFVIVVGGGKTSRNYMSEVKKCKLEKTYQSQVGVYATLLNASLIASFFKPKSRIIMPYFYDEFLKIYKKNKIAVIGGIIPGSTTDGTAAEVSKLID